MRFQQIAAFFVMVGMLPACSSLTSLENVRGDWSCPLIDGVCSDISTIDASLVLDLDGTVPVGGPQPSRQRSEIITASANASGDAIPNRSTEEVAKIVFAPSIDRRGNYHGMREMFTVMQGGLWDVSDDEDKDFSPTHVRPVRDTRPTDLRPSGTEVTELEGGKGKTDPEPSETDFAEQKSAIEEDKPRLEASLDIEGLPSSGPLKVSAAPSLKPAKEDEDRPVRTDDENEPGNTVIIRGSKESGSVVDILTTVSGRPASAEQVETH